MAAYRASTDSGKPLSERKLAAMFGKTSRRWARYLMAQATGRAVGQDRVGADPPPDDMGLAGDVLFAVAESRAAVVVPGHLEHAGVGGHTLDAQPGAEGVVGRGQVRHERVSDDLAEVACCCAVRFFQSRSNRGSVSKVGITHPLSRAN